MSTRTAPSSAPTRRRVLALAGASAALGALTACGSAVTGEKSAGSDAGGDSRTVRVGHLSSSLFAPLYVADATKQFEKAGITIELVPLKSG